MRVSQVSAARRSVWLNGTVADMEAAFGVTLQEYSLPGGGTYRGHTGPIMIPADLAGIIVGVFGLDNRPQARPSFRLRRNHHAGNPRSGRPPPRRRPQFTPDQVARLYNFPAGVDGTGECIAHHRAGRRVQDGPTCRPTSPRWV